MRFLIVFWLSLTSLTLAQPAWSQSEDESMSDDESYVEETYDDDSYDDGGGGSRITSTASPLGFIGLFQPDWSPLKTRLATLLPNSRDNAVADSPKLVIGPQLRTEAEIAYRYGNLPLAIELYYGHLARGGAAASADLKSVQYNALQRVPAWHVRLGVSMAIRGDAGITDPSPIKSGSNTRSFDDGSFDDGSSDFADDSSMDDGSDFGVTSRRTGAVAVPPPRVTDPDANEQLARNLGYVAETVASELDRRIKSGQFGRALADVGPPQPGQGFTIGGREVPSPAVPMWRPGVLFLGEGHATEMPKQSLAYDVDVLLHFDVSLKEARENSVQNVSRLRVIDCRSGKTIVTSGAMDTAEVERLQWAKRGDAEDHVTEQLATLWRVIDDKLSLQPLPKLSAESARRRVAMLMGDSSLSKLRQLAEIRTFSDQELLTAPELEQAFEIVAGEDGLTILNGAEQDAAAVVLEMAERAAMPQL